MAEQLVEAGGSTGPLFRVGRLLHLGVLGLVTLWASSYAHAGPIDLRQFTIYDSGPVDLGSADGTAAGSFARLNESETAAVVVLFDDPATGTTPLIRPEEGPSLRFFFDFLSEPDCASGDFPCEEFYVRLFNADTGAVIDDRLFAPSSAGETFSAEVLFANLLTVGITYGLEFQFLSYDAGLGASLYLSGLEVFDPDAEAPVTVPEPGTLTLLASGLVGLAFRRRGRSRALIGTTTA